MSTIVRLTPPGQLPVQKMVTKLIVLCAFDRNEDGSLQAAFEPREMQDERRANSTAREMSHRHVGVITWVREVDPAAREYGPSEVLYQSGDIPDLD